MYNHTIYKKLPVPVQESLISTRSGIRRNLREIPWLMKKIDAELKDNEYLDEHGFKSLKLKNLKQILKFAQTWVPYYRDVFRKIGFHYEDLNRLCVMNDLPLLTKETVIENMERFRPRFPRNVIKVSGKTSGTSGSPLTVNQNPMAVFRERAFQRRIGAWAGFTPGKRNVWLRGDAIVPIDQKKPPFWRHNAKENQLMMSSYHLSEKSVLGYVEKIREFKPDLISAYPSALFTIACFMDIHQIEPIEVGRIITSSETLFPEQRKIIEAKFLTRVFDFYGSFERVALIATCEYGQYHVFEDYGCTEFLHQEEDLYEIVSTGFNNLYMPLIRYKSGDLVEKGRDAPCPCGRRFRSVESISGRSNDYLMLPDGRKFMGLGFLFKGDISILEGQIYQNKDYSVELRIVPGKDFGAEDERILVNNARQRLGQEMDVRVICCSAIPRTKTGKFKTIVSEIGLMD